MGFQLGPGFLRRPPRGWTPAVAYPLHHRASDHPEGAEPGESVFDTSYLLEVTWRVERPGAEPYEVTEQRTAPVWVRGGPLGAGKRWYKVRVRPTGGLVADAPIPVHVDPDDPQRLWVDWDGAHDVHVPLWERDARVKRALAERDGGLDAIVERVVNPFAGRLRDGEQALVDAKAAERATRDERTAARYAELARDRDGMPVGGENPDETARQQAWLAELEEIHRTGRKLRATVVGQRETGETVCGVPVVEVVFDVREHGGAVRRVVYENLSGPRAVKRYAPGVEVDVWLAPGAPDRICPGR
jgi:hypothetical protein